MKIEKSCRQIITFFKKKLSLNKLLIITLKTFISIFIFIVYSSFPKQTRSFNFICFSESYQLSSLFTQKKIYIYMYQLSNMKFLSENKRIGNLNTLYPNIFDK